MRLASPRFTLEQLRGVFEDPADLLGAGRQGTVAKTKDGKYAVKRQSLEQSEQERRQGVTPDSAAYMAARVGQEGLGPRVIQYEIDPVENVAYLAMENLMPMGYRSIKGLDEETYKKLYAQQMLLEAHAASKGIGLSDTHSENVMVNPGTEKLMFIDQGYARPLERGRPRDAAQFTRGVNGLRNLGADDIAEQLEQGFMSAMRSKDQAAINQIANEAVKLLSARIA